MESTNVQDTVRVCAISGSLRAGSFTSVAVRAALGGAEQFGAETEFLDLRRYELPVHTGEETSHPGVIAFRNDIRSADGLILGTPEYHGSFSGALKNALDFLSFDEMEGKMIGLVGVSAGAMGAFDAMNGLRSVGRSLHAWVVPQQAAVPEVWKNFSPAGDILDAQVADRLVEVGREVARFAHLHKCGQVREFLRDWETATPNPGARAARKQSL